ncbi:hypothetical protein H9Q74_013708 [Fusarium xylarioides]|nr:hypothetical protein H9Q71_010161 [Fusarium xylarioides]KAG5811115.1 hypothetical protein H9Q74_013708 [Fusarium xylarioides]
MHLPQLITAAALFTQGTIAVGIKTYTGRDCTGTEQTLSVDHNAACNPKVQRFQSYKENRGVDDKFCICQKSASPTNPRAYVT